MEQQNQNNNSKKLRISELAKMADVSAATIRYYVREGLLPEPEKTAKTMAYYDESMVERIQKIKKLQREKFLPLDLIKRVIDAEDTDDEADLGRAIFKTDKLRETPPVPESKVESKTGYPLGRVRALEEEGLISPEVTEKGRLYDGADMKTIELLKVREDLGVPFDHSISILRAYRDAIKDAVTKDLRLFADGVLGDVSTRQAIKLMTEADDTLDAFMVLYRHRLIREAGRDAFADLGRLSEKLSAMNFLPVKGDDLGAESDYPDDAERFLFFMLKGRYGDAAYLAEGKTGWTAARIFALVLADRVADARALVERKSPEPAGAPLVNAAAALALMHDLGRDSGLSSPMFLAKRAMSYLRRIESHQGNDVETALARYVCGAIYVVLPSFFGTAERGITLLERAAADLGESDLLSHPLADRFANVISDEVAPALQARAHRFLAEGLLRTGKGK